ncbi:MAG: hypothetical protein JWO44_1938 [Bacteroidetes bacterium]|nr:hypothetical protein [Bacteroidota bacterium]
MSRESYRIVFSVDVSHSYFEGGICSCLQFNPDELTAALLKRFGFIVRSRTSGFDLYSNTAGSLAALFNYMKEVSAQDHFDFQLLNSNGEFYHFTELPADWVGQLVYDSHSGEPLSNGNIQLPAALSAQAALPEFGSLVIRFDDLLKLNDQPACFRIGFNARATQWQYYIINRSGVQLENPAISGKANIAFEGPENVLIPDGQKALLFSSGSLLPLSELPNYKFDLVNNPSAEQTKKTSAKVIIKGLPNADPKRTGIAAAMKNQVSSPIYIYL